MRAPGFLSRLLSGRSSPVETRGQTLDVLAQAYGFRLGRSISPILAENLSVVAGCVGAICTGISSLPLRLYRGDGAGGRVEVTDHPLIPLLRRPNRHQAWPGMVETWLSSALLHGNGLVVIDSDPAGGITALRPVLWNQTQVNLLPSGRVAFDITFPNPYGPVAPPVRVFEEDTLWLKDRSDDSIIGRSRLDRSADVFANAQSLQQFTGNFWEDGLAPAATMTHPKTLSDGARKRMKADIEEFRGGSKRKTLLLEEGLELKPWAISPEAAELLASRKFGVSEICRVYQVPPVLVADFENATLQNAATAARWFAQFTLAGWAAKLEAELAQLLPAGMSAAFDMSSLLRGDPETQTASAIAAVTGGLMTANEARRSLGLPTHRDGDRLRAMPGEPGAGPATPAAPPRRPNGRAPDMPATVQ